MLKETFRYLEYSNEKTFEQIKSGTIQLKEYIDSLKFRASYEGIMDATYGQGVLQPTIEGNPEIVDFSGSGDFGKHVKLNDGVIIYNSDNFNDIKNGTISFYISSDFSRAAGYYSFNESEPVLELEDNTSFNFEVIIDDSVLTTKTIEVSPVDDGDDIFNKIASSLSSYTSEVTVDVNKRKIQSQSNGVELIVKDVGDNSINDLFGSGYSIVPNGPEEGVTFLTLRENNGNNNNKINFIHNTNSEIIIEMYDKNGKIKVNENIGIWSNTDTKFYHMELGFNDQFAHFYIDGKLKKIFMTNEIERDNINTYLILRGDGENKTYKMDEIIVYNEFINYKNFTPKRIMSPYDTTNPYVDIHFGSGFKDDEVKDIIIEGSDELSASVKIGSNWYYYFSGSWRISNGSYSQSTNKELFEVEFANLFFNQDYDLIIRLFFNSDGYNNCLAEEISIIKEEGGETSASITGQVQLTSPVDLSEDASVLITTNKGEKEIILTSHATDETSVSLEEIKESIKQANVPGLKTVSDDGNGRLVLVAETEGVESYISIDDTDSDSALAIVWGDASDDTGSSSELASKTYKQDYEELYRYVRSRLGAPLVPVELTDEQIDDCLSEVIFEYDRWRNFEESLEILTIQGNPKDGWEIPPVVGDPRNILEVIMRPRYPAGYYTGRNDIMENIYIQHIFNRGQIMNNIADHHIAMVANTDLNIIMDTTITWEIINKKLFIKPHPPGNSLEVGIKFKSILSLDEILNNQQIKNLLVAEAKITLGNIRSTFGNQIPGGEGMIQLNGSELKQEGMQEKQAIIEDWKKSTNVYEFIIG